MLFEFLSIKFVLCFYLRDSEADQGPYAIILAPTRELAQQVSSICSTLRLWDTARGRGLRTTLQKCFLLVTIM